MSEDRRSRPRALALAALVAGSLVVGLLLTEVAHRVARHWICAGRPTNTLYEHKDGYGWGHRASAVGRMYACIGRKYEWQLDVRTNAHGLRGEDRPYAKPDGVRRVLLLGDSITEAMQVPLETTFASRLEASLRSTGMKAEVVNGGVAAFATDNELLFYRAEGSRYAPDVVLLVLNLANDVSESSPRLNGKMYGTSSEHLLAKTYFRLDAEGRLVPMPPASIPSVAPSLWSQIESRFYLLRAIRRAFETPPPVDLDFTSTVFGVMSRSPDPEWVQAWAMTEALVRQLRDDVEKSGARFAVAMMPNREMTSASLWRLMVQAQPLLAERYDPDAPARRMAAFLAREGIPYVDLLPPLRNAAETTGVTGFFAADVHLDPTGHERVAHALAPFVTELLAQSAGTAH